MSKELTLRYGCNPHQQQARAWVETGEMPLQVLCGQPGYINLLDALSGWQLVRELAAATQLPAAASFKHTSPAGAAVALPLSDTLRQVYMVGDRPLSALATAYARARGGDRMSSYGDFIACSHPVDASTAELIRPEVSDGIIAPGYDTDALAILRAKKQGKYLVLAMDPTYEPPLVERREVFGIWLSQERNARPVAASILSNVVTRRREFPATAVRDLLVATVALKYAQSNSVCFAYDGQVIGLGAGQQSRIHCTRLAASKAAKWLLQQHPRVLNLRFRENAKRPDRMNAIDQYLIWDDLSPQEREALGQLLDPLPGPLSPGERQDWLAQFAEISLSSDGFFPFRDNIDAAHRAGVRYVVQPGGSIADESVIAAADGYGMVMAFSNLRLFHH